MIKLNKLVKAFGSRVVLRGLDLHIAPGEFVIMLGANGAGKTTLMNVAATLTRPTAGQVWVGGMDAHRHAAHIRRYIGLVSHKTLLYDDLSGAQNLQFYARMYDVPRPQQRIETVLHQVGLWGRQEEPVRTYSRGMQQRLAIARAILHDPPVLLLDEPDTGLDQRAASLLGELLTAVGLSRRTVLMTTHNLERGLSLGNRTLILANGQIACDVARESVSAAELAAIYTKLLQAGQKQ